MKSDGKNSESNERAEGITLVSQDNDPVDLHLRFKGSSAFLLCSGPSLRDVDLSPLNSRGVLTCAVNNAATLFRSQLWVAFDHPGHFSELIWRDPAILKFIPQRRLKQFIRVRDGGGELVESNELARDMPATFGYVANDQFCPDTWLDETTINCGDSCLNSNSETSQGVRSVMLVALKLLYYLGVRRVFLLGCDFRMSYGSENYAFEQHRSRKSIRINNQIYRTLTERLKMLLPHFESHGYEVFNCTPKSCLDVFSYIEMADAVELATEAMPKNASTAGMYD